MRIVYVSDFDLHKDPGTDGKNARPCLVIETSNGAVGILKIYGEDSKKPGYRVKLDAPISGGNRESSWVDRRYYILTEYDELIKIGTIATYDITRRSRVAITDVEVAKVTQLLGGQLALNHIKKKIRNEINRKYRKICSANNAK